MAKRGGRQRAAARQREKDRKERAERKRERRAERAESRAATGTDPELAGITPGPQPREAIDDAEVQAAVERVLRPGSIGGGERPMSPAKAAACRLFVGNLDSHVDAASLRRHFTTSGYDVVDASVVKDRASGQSRGFAFVELKSPEAAREAVTTLDGVDLDGRALRIRSASDRPPGRG